MNDEMPCWGNPLEDNYACSIACRYNDECYMHMVKKMAKGKSLAEFPELLVHTNPKVRYHVKLLMEQLIEK